MGTIIQRASVVVTLTLLPAVVSGQSAEVAGDNGALPRARAERVEGDITLDGRLEERAWADAPPITGFTQNDPEEGEPVSQPTEVRILYDDVAVYVGAMLRDTAPVSSRLGRRDAWLRDSDWFSVSFDSHNDHLTAYRFMVNPAGVRSDEILSAGDWFRGDDSWDPVWEVATTVTDSGWVAEMRIPFSQLRFSGAEEQVWGMQLERTIARRQEEAVFSFTPKRERGGIARYGHLVGIRDIHRGAGLELLPYALARGEYVDVEQSDEVAFVDPYRDGSDYFASAGLDLKYHLASNLTLDATVNPDFGQVELDPAVVNLTAYETRFRERRPFFVEGSDIFEFGGGGGTHGFSGGTQLLYSRRIGAAPRWGVPDDAVYEDEPDALTILGAVKLTGRTASGWTIGLLEAVTDEEVARYVDIDGLEGEEVVAPLTSYFAARAERNFRDGQTVVGGLATAVHRRLGSLDLASEFRGKAFTGGVDFSHEWADRAWSVSGFIAGSRIAGSAEAIAEAQESSARYYDRPDADHLDYDSTATSLAGYSARLELSKEAGLHWRGDVELSATSPGFEANDLGYQRDADRMRAEGSIRYVETVPGPVFRDWSVSVDTDGTWSYGREFLGAGVGVRARGELLSYWGGHLSFTRDFAGYDDRLTRGGPLARSVARDRVSLRFDSDQRKPWQLRGNGSYSRDAAGGTRFDVGLDMEVRPSATWSLSMGPEWEHERSPAQYLGAVDDPLKASTYGRRYLFAELDRRTLSLETRLNVTFRPGLTLEVYARPFVASADFGAVQELERPGTYAFLTYGEDVGTVTQQDGELLIDPDGAGPAAAFTVGDYDFNRRSLRGSAVLRWEWWPGSTLFLVWQQVRSDYAEVADLALRRDAQALFGAPADNVLLLKISYWLSP